MNFTKLICRAIMQLEMSTGPALYVASAEGIICVEKIAGHHPEPRIITTSPDVPLYPGNRLVGYTKPKPKKPDMK